MLGPPISGSNLQSCFILLVLVEHIIYYILKRRCIFRSLHVWNYFYSPLILSSQFSGKYYCLEIVFLQNIESIALLTLSISSWELQGHLNISLYMKAFPYFSWKYYNILFFFQVFCNFIVICLTAGSSLFLLKNKGNSFLVLNDFHVLFLWFINLHFLLMEFLLFKP